MEGRGEGVGSAGRTLWLVGMMGSGKSTVGPLIAEALGMPFVDSDREVEAAAAEDPASLLARDEEGFRDRERSLIGALAGRSVVAATGGGAVLDAGNVAAMRGSGLVVWLDAPADVLARRVGAGEGRPLLGDDPSAALERILAERLQRYRSAAHVVVSSRGAPDAVAAEVVAVWGAP